MNIETINTLLALVVSTLGFKPQVELASGLIVFKPPLHLLSDGMGILEFPLNRVILED
jgi:hypothetical protein